MLLRRPTVTVCLYRDLLMAKATKCLFIFGEDDLQPWSGSCSMTHAALLLKPMHVLTFQQCLPVMESTEGVRLSSDLTA